LPGDQILRNQLSPANGKLQLRALPKRQQQAVDHRLTSLQDGLMGDVKKLYDGTYRLRVGKLRVFFTLAGDSIVLYVVEKRKDAYK
jgi:mRNA-degrading endonuclease RelE of RelBE toxin-antitoxin system